MNPDENESLKALCEPLCNWCKDFYGSYSKIVIYPGHAELYVSYPREHSAATLVAVIRLGEDVQPPPIPSKGEVLAYGQSIGAEHALEWYEWMELNEFRDKNGILVKNWKKALEYYELFKKMRYLYD